MKNLKYICIFTFCICCLSAAAQSKADKNAAKLAAIKVLVDDQRFNFVAQYANPQGGGHRFLSSEYDLRIRKDSLIAYLPYFGRAYFDVPYNPTDGGIKFSSTKFTYKVTVRKKGGWDILIEPEDTKYYRRIDMYVSSSGNASASFNITNKSFITFDGYVTPADKEK